MCCGGDLILAAILLSTSPDVPECEPHQETYPALRDAIHKVAIDLELMDERESRYLLIRPEDFVVDLRLLRQRYHEYRKSPPLSDSRAQRRL